ncbi:MAG TPA: DNA polymerase III subunit delta', partial [Desulfobacteria bacterium]|nr:DNA polymerase III subunit delta' [Desulfobacteria bacterium]
MLFGQIIGHEQPKKIFKNAIADGRFAHAYLLHGMPGVGKKSLASALVANLFCPDRNGDACGVCPTCRRVEKNNHPDFFIIGPSGNNIKIEQVREIQKKVQLRPYEGTIKVFLITESECMTREASNCLLKILEEPPSDTVFLLTANNLYSLMPTIISRCQTIPVGKVPLDKIEQLLQSHGLEEEKARLYASLSDGVPGAALGLALT